MKIIYYKYYSILNSFIIVESQKEL